MAVDGGRGCGILCEVGEIGGSGVVEGKLEEFLSIASTCGRGSGGTGGTGGMEEVAASLVGT